MPAGRETNCTGGTIKRVQHAPTGYPSRGYGLAVVVGTFPPAACQRLEMERRNAAILNHNGSGAVLVPSGNRTRAKIPECVPAWPPGQRRVRWITTKQWRGYLESAR